MSTDLCAMNGVAELQTLSRGLAALAFLNENGLTDVATLTRHLGIPRGNAVRILKTLMTAGYCTRLPDSRLYQVSPQVRRLASGAREAEVLTSVSIAIVERLGEAVEWPVTLATPLGPYMVIRLTTDRHSPLALNRIAPGHEAELLLTALGIAYLAHEHPRRRVELLAQCRAESQLAVRHLPTLRQDQLIAFAAAQGYSVMQGAHTEGGIAVPILHRGKPLGSLGMRYMRRGMPGTSLIDRFLPKLRAASADIARLYAVANSASSGHALQIAADPAVASSRSRSVAA